MILPVYAGLERIPDSFLEASSDLGGRSWRTFRRVILPLAFPAVVAGSIFTFCLTLGDYIAPQLVSTTQFIGNLIFANVGAGGNLPLAAAFALVPLTIIVIYLIVARKLGASRRCDARRRGLRIGLRVMTIAILAFIYAPITLIFVYSLNAGTTTVWPPVGLSFRWYAEAIQNTGLQRHS